MCLKAQQAFNVMVVVMTMPVPVMRRMHIVPHGTDAFLQLIRGHIPIHVETHFATHEIHFHVLYTFRFQVFMNGECTIGATHPFHLPIHFFHITKLPHNGVPLFFKSEISFLPGCNSGDIFATSW
jgi:hypothetical protein